MYYVYPFIQDILDQVIFWSEISKEHPIVINTLANTTNKSIPESLQKHVSSYTAEFNEIQKKARELQKRLNSWMMVPPYVYGQFLQDTIKIVRRFQSLNIRWLKTLRELTAYDKDDQVWQTLLQHITEEQLYASNVMNSFLKEEVI